MACNCSSPQPSGLDPSTQTPLPTIEALQALGACGGAVALGDSCCDDSLPSCNSDGSTLPSALTDARCVGPGEGITLLGRIGATLARFSGNGFLQLLNGKAYVVSSVPLVIRQLWHRYFRVGSSSTPVLGDPHPFPYGVVADLKGSLYGIRGFDTRKALHVWNFETAHWETISPDQFPLEVSRRIFQSDGIELIGFEPVPILGSPSDVRNLRALSGAGIVYLERVATAADDVPANCEPCADAGFAYVAKVALFPVATGSQIYDITYTSTGIVFDLR